VPVEFNMLASYTKLRGMSISACYHYLVLYATQIPLFNSGPDNLSGTWTCEEIVARINQPCQL